MENLMLRNQTRMHSSTPISPAALSINRDSKTISKPKPKIRIIHIFAPEIINTDVANFRELVQTLTGKPPQEKGCQESSKICRKDHSFCNKPPAAAATMVGKKMELMRTGFIPGLVKEEEGMLWGNINGDNSSGFLSGLGDLDGFIQELSEFPLQPLDHMHGFEDVQFA